MSTTPIKILLIENETQDACLLQELLAEAGGIQLELTQVVRMSDALHHLGENRFNIILLNLSLPDSQGLDSFNRIKTEVPEVPVVILTNVDNHELAVKAVQEGAQDYLVKGQINSSMLMRSIRHALERQRIMDELKQSQRLILEQQNTLLEEERLKVLIQMAGATAHELSQPLTSMLCNIDLLKKEIEEPTHCAMYLDSIEKDSKRIAATIRRIRNIRHYDIKPYYGSSFIIDIDQKILILSVEDVDSDFEMIQACVEEQEQVTLTRAHTIENVLCMVEQEKFDIILSHYQLLDGNGVDLLTALQRKGFDIPVVIITKEENEMAAWLSLKAGASDYLTKDMVSKSSLFRSIVNALEKAHLKREIKNARKRIVELSTIDEPTGLYNRRYFMEVLERECERARRYKTGLLLFMMDIDNFKWVTDTYGHPAGDMVITEIGKMLKRCIRKNDFAFRYGGEEFAVLLSHTQVEKALEVCERLRKAIEAHPFEYNLSHFEITISAGVSSSDHSKAHTPSELLARATRALSLAKATGKKQVTIYHDQYSPEDEV
jgi:two-component system cell cycle response regulator